MGENKKKGGNPKKKGGNHKDKNKTFFFGFPLVESEEIQKKWGKPKNKTLIESFKFNQ